MALEELKRLAGIPLTEDRLDEVVGSDGRLSMSRVQVVVSVSPSARGSQKPFRWEVWRKNEKGRPDKILDKGIGATPESAFRDGMVAARAKAEGWGR